MTRKALARRIAESYLTSQQRGEAPAPPQPEGLRGFWPGALLLVGQIGSYAGPTSSSTAQPKLLNGTSNSGLALIGRKRRSLLNAETTSGFRFRWNSPNKTSSLTLSNNVNARSANSADISLSSDTIFTSVSTCSSSHGTYFSFKRGRPTNRIE